MPDLDTITLPRNLVERAVVKLSAAASSAEERGLLLGAEGYLAVMKELAEYLKPAPVHDQADQAELAGERR